MAKRKSWVGMAVVALMLVARTHGADIWYVAPPPVGSDDNNGSELAPFATITNAVAQSANGDTIRLLAGTHAVSNEVLVAKGITIEGIDGATNTTVSRAGSTAFRVFQVTHNDAVLRGITVSNGNVRGLSAHGGGLRMSAGKLLDSIVTDNISGNHSGNSDGAGIYLSGSAIVSNSVIRNNVNGEGYDQNNGGGIFLSSANNLVIDCVITNNRVTSNYRPRGGGVYVNAGTVERCIIVGNRATGTTRNNSAHWGGGAGVLVVNGTVRNSLIAGNALEAIGTHRLGAGIRMEGSGGTIENCTIVRNHNVNTYGGIYHTGGTIKNCIIVDNSATSVSNLAYTAGVTYSMAPELLGTFSNLAIDPLFIDPGSGYGLTAAIGNYRLRLESPAVDSGTTAAGALDLDGHPRTLDGIGDGTATPDRGCFEINPAVGPFRCALRATPLAGLDPLTVTLTASVAGTNTTITAYVWDFTNDGIPDESGADKRVVSHEYIGIGPKTVSLTVTNSLGEVASLTRTDYIVVSGYTYVSSTGSHEPPFETWATAATNIQAAIDAATLGGAIVVTNGTYRLGTAISIQKQVTLQSVNGPEATILDGGWTTRVLEVGDPNAVVDGFTITRGWASSGAGIHLAGGTIENCIIRNNKDQGAGTGGGVWMNDGALRNCLIVGNHAGASTLGSGRGGGVAISGGLIENCTIARNATGLSEGGVYKTGGTIVNSIIYDNRAPSAANINTTTDVTYSCAPELTSGTGNITANPRFAQTGYGYGFDHFGGDFRLGLGSPCLDAGSERASVTSDLDGTPRPVDGNGSGVAATDMGAYETPLAPHAGDFRCYFSAPTIAGAAPLQVIFTAAVAGTDTNNVSYAWDLTGDGVTDAVGPVATNTYTENNQWVTVRLFATNGVNDTAEYVRTRYVQLPFDAAYVSTNGAAQPPYATWATAARDIHSAIEEIGGANSPQVSVSNGTYNLTAQIVINKGVSVLGLGGLSNTVVNGQGMTRCVQITHAGAVLDGFTLTNGYATVRGAGLEMTAAARVRNCLIIGNVCQPPAGVTGGSVYMNGGRIEDSEVRANAFARGAGQNTHHGTLYAAGGAVVSNCVIAANLNTVSGAHEALGAGVYLTGGSKLLNSTVANNEAWNGWRTSGGGVYMDNNSGNLISHCFILGNQAGGGSQYVRGGGVRMLGGTLRNSLIAGNSDTVNSSPGSGGVIMSGGTIENCTIVRNSSANSHGGIYRTGGTVVNTIVYFNAAGSGTVNIDPDANVTYSCAPELTSGTGNRTDDPDFVNNGDGYGHTATLGNYEIKSASPLVNQGLDLAWMTPGSVDLADNPRIQMGRVDIGAYETMPPRGTLFMMR